MDLSFLFTLLKTCLNPQRANMCTKAKHNKFSILHFHPPPFLGNKIWNLGDKMAENGKIKILPPSSSSSCHHIFSGIIRNKEVKYAGKENIEFWRSQNVLMSWHQHYKERIHHWFIVIQENYSWLIFLAQNSLFHCEQCKPTFIVVFLIIKRVNMYLCFIWYIFLCNSEKNS